MMMPILYGIDGKTKSSGCTILKHYVAIDRIV